MDVKRINLNYEVFMVRKMLKRIFARNITERRKQLGWTMVDLAARSGVGKSTISYIEAGNERSGTQLETIERIAKGFNVQPWKLLIDNKESQDQKINTLCSMFEALSSKNKNKVMEYCDDLLKAQHS